jgi:hypothetical protein
VETYEQKVERVAVACWMVGLVGELRTADRWPKVNSGMQEKYRRVARAALEEEARDIEEAA